MRPRDRMRRCGESRRCPSGGGDGRATRRETCRPPAAALEEELAARQREFLKRDGSAEARFVILAHDAELGARVECESGGAVVAVHKVAAKAEEDEAALDEPSQKVEDL